MPQPVPPPQQPPPDHTFATFAGIKNTVPPERLTERELSRARNVDLDDLGSIARRRGRRRVAGGRWTSVFNTSAGLVFGVVDGAFVLVNRDYSLLPIFEGVADEPLSYVEIAHDLYATSRFNSFHLDTRTLQVEAWGLVRDHSYQPGLLPTVEADFWLSTVLQPDDRPAAALGAVGGRLLGPPPLGQCAAYHNGRIYIGSGSTEWATELYAYRYVDKTANYRQYEDEITGICSVEDGRYVGTKRALYWVTGRYGEEQRVTKMLCGVVPGSMVNAPGEVIDPEGRRFPDLPRQASKGMVCLTTEGMVVGLGGGQVYNVTRTHMHFPLADRAPSFFRQEDGSHTYVSAMHSSGGPQSSARFGDYCEGTIIRAGTAGQPGGRQA